MKTMNHAAYKAKVKGMTDSQLRFVIKDAQAAIRANGDNPNCYYYQDEIHYCSEELTRRKNESNKEVGVNSFSFVMYHRDGSAVECCSAEGLPLKRKILKAIASRRFFLFLRDAGNNVVVRIPIVSVNDTVSFAITNQRPPQFALDQFYDWLDR